MIWPFKKQERRTWPRRPVRLDVMYAVEPPLTLTTSVDMSAHSLAFRCSQAYGLGTALDVRVLLDPAQPETGWFAAKSKVMRCDTGIVAVDFTSVSSDNAKKIDSFFARLETTAKP